MEEKRFDPYQFIGFILIALILTWMLYRNQPTVEPTVQTPTEAVENSDTPAVAAPQSTEAIEEEINSIYGPFAGFMKPITTQSPILENDVLRLSVNPKGGI